MVIKNKKEQGQKAEMITKVVPEDNITNKITGNPNQTIEQAAKTSGNQNTPVFEQAVDVEDIDKVMLDSMKTLKQTCYNFSLKYSEVSGDFKKVGDALNSYENVLNQKIALLQQQQKNNKKQ